MNYSDAQLQEMISGSLRDTLSPQAYVRKAAEQDLLRLETSCPNFALATLCLTQKDELSYEVRTLAAIAFKNFVKKHWHHDPADESKDYSDGIDPQTRESVKREITKMMLNSSSHIQRQLSEAITIIAQSDFPEKWSWLINELEASLSDKQNVNLDKVLGILQTAHSVFRRYRHELQSDRLWLEIKLVIDSFAQPFTDRFKDLMLAIKNPPSDPTQLAQIYQSILLCAKIYLSLITQDLPEFFEDRLADWLPSFIELLNIKVELKDSPSTIEDLKSEICEIASLFVQRYSDAENSKRYTQQFAQEIWNLLVTTDQDVSHDTLVSTAIRYLITVAQRPESRSLFQEPGVLSLICERIIVPNFLLRDIDEELFEDDPEEYVRRDIEGSDVDTRRRAACDLVQALCKFLEAQMIETFGRFIEGTLEQYQSNKSTYWKCKDLAIFLFSSMAIKGSTRQHGTVSISEHVNIERFLEEKVVQELSNSEQHSGSQILKADALRYITTFRNYIPLNCLVKHLPLIVSHISSSNVVVRTYASITLEKLLTMRDPSNPSATAFKWEQFEPYLGQLVNTLFDALEMPGSPENEHIMKAIMRLFSFTKSQTLILFLPTLVPKMTQKLGVVARNPSKPYFNHYLFETLALLIRAACSQENQNIQKEFENVLFNIFEVILAQDVQEFIPYVLQLLNLVLQAQKVGEVSDKFKNLFQEALGPSLWSRPANLTPLTEFMQIYIEKMGRSIINENKLLPLLGIFQKLISSKATDHEGLAMLQTMMIHLPASEMDARISDIFMLIFQRLTGSKTVKFVKGTLVCFSLYAYLRGPDQLALGVNKIQDKIFGMVIEKLFIADVKKVTSLIERRICTTGVIKILSHLPLIDNGIHSQLWSPLLLALMEILELPPEVVNDDDDHFADITESLDFQAQYSKLNYATRKQDDPTKEITDFKSMLAVSLANLSEKLPGFVPEMLKSIDQGVTNCLRNYCQTANVIVS